jgi:hypothetical protein
LWYFCDVFFFSYGEIVQGITNEWRLVHVRKIELETAALNIKTALSSPSFDLATGVVEH